MHEHSGTTIRGQGNGKEYVHVQESGPEGESTAVRAAWQAAESYWSDASRRYGTPRPPDPSEDPSWSSFAQLAVMCVARGWDVCSYVKSVMSRPGQRCILPKDLGSKANAEWYSAKQVQDSGSAEEEYRKCVELVIQRELDGTDEKPLLLSPSSAFPAWFRVSYPEVPDMEIIGLWGDAARAEFDSSPKRAELIRRLFPDKWDRLRRLLWFYGGPAASNEGKEGGNGL